MLWDKLLTVTLLSATLLPAQTLREITSGLLAPQKLILTPGKNFLVTETSTDINAARLSFVSRAGTRRSLFEGLPSGVNNVGEGSGATAMVLSGRTLYLAIGSGDAERAGTTPGTALPNPQGISSPLLSSVLQIDFSQDVDNIGGTFVLTAAHQQSIADGNTVTLPDGADSHAAISLLTRVMSPAPDPNTIYRFSNPWGMALGPNGRLWLADASMNALYSIDTATGRMRKGASFPPSPNPAPVGGPVIEAVPTSVRIYGNQLLVSFLTGFPFLGGHARVMAIDPQTGHTEPFIFGLNSATDVLYRPMTNGASQFYVLEFSTSQLGTPPGPGRLLKYDSPQGTVVTDQLTAPVSMQGDEDAGAIYVLELTGRLVEVTP